MQKFLSFLLANILTGVQTYRQVRDELIAAGVVTEADGSVKSDAELAALFGGDARAFRDAAKTAREKHQAILDAAEPPPGRSWRRRGVGGWCWPWWRWLDCSGRLRMGRRFEPSRQQPSTRPSWRSSSLAAARMSQRSSPGWRLVGRFWRLGWPSVRRW
jgi:hypothetical protein